MLYVWFGLFVIAAVLLVFSAIAACSYKDENDGLHHRIFAAQENLFPLLDNALYRSVKTWRKEHPEATVLALGGTALEADRLIRAFYWLKPSQEEKEKLANLLGKIGAKFGVYIKVDFGR